MFCVLCFRHTMSGTLLDAALHGHRRLNAKDFSVATPEEFVKRFGGNKVINRVSTFHQIIL